MQKMEADRASVQGGGFFILVQRFSRRNSPFTLAANCTYLSGPPHHDIQAGWGTLLWPRQPCSEQAPNQIIAHHLHDLWPSEKRSGTIRLIPWESGNEKLSQFLKKKCQMNVLYLGAGARGPWAVCSSRDEREQVKRELRWQQQGAEKRADRQRDSSGLLAPSRE